MREWVEIDVVDAGPDELGEEKGEKKRGKLEVGKRFDSLNEGGNDGSEVGDFDDGVSGV